MEDKKCPFDEKCQHFSSGNECFYYATCKDRKEEDELRSQLADAKAENKRLRELCRNSIAVFDEGDQTCEVLAAVREIEQALTGKEQEDE